MQSSPCGSRSETLIEAIGESLRKTGPADAALGLGHVVRNAVPGEQRLLVVVDGKGGAPVEIARLTDRAGVEEIANSVSKLQFVLGRQARVIVLRLETKRIVSA